MCMCVGVYVCVLEHQKEGDEMEEKEVKEISKSSRRR